MGERISELGERWCFAWAYGTCWPLCCESVLRWHVTCGGLTLWLFHETVLAFIKTKQFCLTFLISVTDPWQETIQRRKDLHRLAAQGSSPPLWEGMAAGASLHLSGWGTGARLAFAHFYPGRPGIPANGVVQPAFKVVLLAQSSPLLKSHQNSPALPRSSTHIHKGVSSHVCSICLLIQSSW